MTHRMITTFASALFLVVGEGQAVAQSATVADESGDRVAELERKVEALGREMETMRVPQAAAEPALAPTLGFSPAAAKVYGVRQGVSLGGYGEVTAESFADEREDGKPAGKANTWDAARAIMYLGYKFDDRLVFNSETEFEHGHDKVRGEVSVEFMYLDWRAHDWLGVRGGMLLPPMGLTNELHEPVLYPSVKRPSVESVIIPTTWRENGAGAYGEIGPVSWRGYVLAGLQGVKDAAVKGFTASGIRDGRQKGSKSLAETVAGVFRVDCAGPLGLIAGGSLYGGRSGQNVLGSNKRTEIRARTSLAEGHVTFQHRGLDLRGLYAQGAIGSVRELNLANGLTGKNSIGALQRGWYVQASFDVLSLASTAHRLSPFVRYEIFDPQERVPSGFSEDPAQEKTETTFGVMYQPHPQVALKADAMVQTTGADTGVNQFNVAIGYLF